MSRIVARGHGGKGRAGNPWFEGKKGNRRGQPQDATLVGCIPVRRFFRTPIDWPQREVKKITLGYIIMYILKCKYSHSTSTKMMLK